MHIKINLYPRPYGSTHRNSGLHLTTVSLDNLLWIVVMLRKYIKGIATQVPPPLLRPPPFPLLRLPSLPRVATATHSRRRRILAGQSPCRGMIAVAGKPSIAA